MNLDRKRVYFTILIIILVFSSVIIHSLNYENDKKIKITIDKGYSDINVEVPPPPKDGEPQENKYFGNGSTAITTVNENKGSLKIEVSPRYWHGPNDAYMCFVLIHVSGEFSSKLNPEELVIHTQGIEAPKLDRLHMDHQSSQWDSEGLELWSPTKRRDGAVGEQETSIGSYVENEGKFSAYTEILIEHPTANLTQEPISIEFRATLQGLSEEVTTTTRVSFTQVEV